MSRRLRIALAAVACFALALALAAWVLLDWRKLGRFLAVTPLSRVGVGVFRPDQTVTIPRADGLELVADVYRAAAPPRPAAVLVLHGNTPIGRRLPIYRIIGTELAALGRTVMTLDFAGFGESGDPFSEEGGPPPDGRQDVELALRWLRELSAERQVFVVARSGGGMGALAVGTLDPDVIGIALIGPPRRVRDVLADPAMQDYYFRRANDTHRRVYGHDLPAWFTREVWLEEALEHGSWASLQADMGLHLDYFRSDGHKPLLLIDDGLATEADRAYLQRYHESIVEPKVYVTIEGSDHYVNTEDLGGLALYDRQVTPRLVEALAEWMSRVEARALNARSVN